MPEINFEALYKTPDHFLNIEPFEQLIDGLFDHPSLTMLHAPSGGMKSYFALALAKAVAQGQSFLGREVKKARKVVYLDSELAPQSVGERLRLLKLDSNNSNLLFITPDDIGLDISEPAQQRALEASLIARKCELLIIDNLRTSAAISENNADEFTSLNQFLKSLRDKGISVWLIHHSNKNSESYAGSSNLVTVFDSVIHLSSSTESVKRIDINKDRAGRLGAIKDNYFSLSETGSAVLNSTSSIDYEFVADLIITKIEQGTITKKEQIISLIRENGCGSSGAMSWAKVHSFLADNSVNSYPTLQALKDRVKQNVALPDDEFEFGEPTDFY